MVTAMMKVKHEHYSYMLIPVSPCCVPILSTLFLAAGRVTSPLPRFCDKNDNSLFFSHSFLVVSLFIDVSFDTFHPVAVRVTGRRVVMTGIDHSDMQLTFILLQVGAL